MKGKGFVIKSRDYDGWGKAFNHFSDFLNQAPNFEGKTYRGLKFENDIEYNAFIKRFSKGNIVRNKGFWSTTQNPNTARGFSSPNRYTPYKVLITINGKTSTIADNFVEYVNELESIFNQNSKFLVKDVKIKTKSVKVAKSIKVGSKDVVEKTTNFVEIILDEII